MTKATSKRISAVYHLHLICIFGTARNVQQSGDEIAEHISERLRFSAEPG